MLHRICYVGHYIVLVKAKIVTIILQSMCMATASFCDIYFNLRLQTAFYHHYYQHF